MRFSLKIFVCVCMHLGLMVGAIERGVKETTNPLHSQTPFQYFSKQFFVSYINDHVQEHLFPNGIRCLHAYFNPIDDDTFFFQFGGVLEPFNYAIFNGTLRKIDDTDCFQMLTSEYYNNLSLCMEENNEEYNYVYVTDMKKKTGFGLIDSLTSPKLDDDIRSIMFKETNGNFHKIDHTDCFQFYFSIP